MKKISIILISIITLFLLTKPAFAFCGFYVAKADKSLYNKASQVVIARNGQRTVLTMANDYQGEMKDFALVVPVPVVLKEDQVNVGDATIIERLDAFSAPRLVEYFDPDPCIVYHIRENFPAAPSASEDRMSQKVSGNSALGVTVEEQFTVGEYDIVILSAKESNGLEIWLRQNGYKIPQGASALLQPYIRQNLKFFVAKVNLKEFAKTGFNSLRPLQMAYESPKFMLPIRLGMINSKGEQDLLVYLLSPKGRIELTNYRTVKVPSDAEIPEFVQQEFSNFYKAMFQKSYTQEGKKVAFLEYAWDMSNCDPCSAEPLNPEELKKAGVFWLNGNQYNSVFISRLHVRYSRTKFPEDLQFQETANQESFQGRYVMRRPFRGELKCSAAQSYKSGVRNRQEQEAQTLAKLTGWDINNIRSKINFIKASPLPWWRNLWN
ncbi:DUF2330 domain-containing protein [Aphanothece hegewaldii CCALA 016]|uniref:DUF2330 domain-containing protein n=1 Tax=Aphanothece hegewaldii CCALA 016 TaxID=2107694 RepID=A0A2T1LYF5_9CHRO|nr:DUF2330 domain-containing protein [Aphanothece hegewaldii]PSF37423.1 DUF2330 domain-containing protein [Aphanothece hegewaldii CCALA 016]